MSLVTDVSSILGQFLLKGWVLTDESCSTCSTPLMRTPQHARPILSICVKCDPQAGFRDATAPPGKPEPVHDDQRSMAASTGSASTTSKRPSTPPTEFSSAQNSPIFAPVLDLAEASRRRAQSDQASAEIGKRLLQGWTMLADECPNATCFGIPLVRPPKRSDGKISFKKECVTCGRTYSPNGSFGNAPAEDSEHSSLRPTSRGEALLNMEDQAQASTSSNYPAQPISVAQLKSKSQYKPTHSQDETQPLEPPIEAIASQNSTQTLAACRTSLTLTLTSLATQLRHASSQNPLPFLLIGEISNAISATTTALQNVQHALSTGV